MGLNLCFAIQTLPKDLCTLSFYLIFLYCRPFHLDNPTIICSGVLETNDLENLAYRVLKILLDLVEFCCFRDAIVLFVLFRRLLDHTWVLKSMMSFSAWQDQ